MPVENQTSPTILQKDISRRNFLKLTAVVGAGVFIDSVYRFGNVSREKNEIDHQAANLKPVSLYSPSIPEPEKYRSDQYKKAKISNRLNKNFATALVSGTVLFASLKKLTPKV